MAFNLQTYLIVSYAINSILCVFFVFLVYSKKKHTYVGKTTLIFLVLGFLYYFSFFMFVLVDDKSAALFWLKACTVSSFLVLVSGTQMMVAMFGENKKYFKSIIAGYVLYVVLSPLVFFTDLVITDVVPKFDIRFWPNIGSWHWLFMLSSYYYMFLPLHYLVKKYFNTQGKEKEQAKYVLLGSIITYFAASTNYPYWYDINFPPIGGFFVASYVVFFVYAIIAHRLMDIKLVVKKSTVYFMAIMATVLLFLPLRLLIDASFQKGQILYDTFLVVLVALVFPRFKKYFSKFANKYMFTSLYDSRELVTHLSAKLRSTLDIELLLNYIRESLVNAFHLKSFGVMLYNEKRRVYTIQYNYHFQVPVDVEFQMNQKLHEEYTAKGKPIVLDDFKHTKNDAFQEIINQMQAFGAEVLVPMNIKDRTIGLMVLGKKEAGDMFSEEDIETLNVIAGLTSTALENARLYVDIKRKNKDLKSLLDMKRDFLRIVNHQLNTPVSIMRLGISSAKEKTISLKRSMEIAEAGLERISSTLQSFWSAYELEGEKMEIEAANFNILELIKEQIKEKKELKAYRERGLEIVIKKPEYELVDVFGDEKKIIHVVSNLLENAILYSKKGRISIGFEYVIMDTRNFLKVLVKDNGIGIPDQDKRNLFKKFIRGSSASLVQPDGSGLGLYIAKKIVEAHDGELKLEKTKEGKGSTFSFTLPTFGNKLPKDSNMFIDAMPINKKALKNKKAIDKPKILFIDEEKELVDLYRQYLSKSGFSVYSTIDIDEIFGLANTVKLDLIVLDIVIPKVQADDSYNMFSEQGYEILMALKNNPETKDIPAVMLSNLNTSKDKQKAIKLGACKFLFKGKTRPKDIVKLFREIGETIK